MEEARRKAGLVYRGNDHDALAYSTRPVSRRRRWICPFISPFSVSASAQTTLKVGFLKTYGLLPLFEAQAKGLFQATRSRRRVHHAEQRAGRGCGNIERFARHRLLGLRAHRRGASAGGTTGSSLRQVSRARRIDYEICCFRAFRACRASGISLARRSPSTHRAAVANSAPSITRDPPVLRHPLSRS